MGNRTKGHDEGIMTEIQVGLFTDGAVFVYSGQKKS